MKNLFLLGLFSVLAFSVNAEEDDHGHGAGHEGDIISAAETGFEIHVETGEALGGEAKLFEADFGDFELGPYATDEPGFILEDGPQFGLSILNSILISKSWNWIMVVSPVMSLMGLMTKTNAFEHTFKF